MLILGVDFETTGLNVKTDLITEVGAILWDTEKKAPMQIMSKILRQPITELDPKITELTGLTLDILNTHGCHPASAYDRLEWLVSQADAVLAHNGNLFDKPMLDNNVALDGWAISQRLWIDSSCDIDFPPHITTRRLSHLAADHGFLNPFPHRAVFDVMTMLTIASRYDWNQMITWAKSPSIVVRADTTYQQKELAKKQNYRWDMEKKVWKKSIKAFQFEDAKRAALEAGFTVTVIEA